MCCNLKNTDLGTSPRQGDTPLTSYSGEIQGAIFIQVSKVDGFKSKNKGNSGTVEVDGSFQQGQDKAQIGRFLVCHDKGNKQY